MNDGDWYVGSLASWDGRDAVLELSFLGEGAYKAEIFQDGVNAKRNAKDYKGKSYPWIMWIHGGGWHIGDFNGHRLQSRFMAGNGIAGVRISYSLLTQGAVFQDTWQDIQDAFRFIQDHAAEYGLDPDRFGFAGHSAGGHLAAYAAMRIPGAKLLISMNGIYDLVHTVPEHVPSSRHNAYFNLPSTQSRAECSPVTFVHEDAPYCLLTYTGGDTLVEKAQVETFIRALDRCHVKYDLIYKDYYCHNGFNDTDLFEPWAMKMLVTAQQYLCK